MKRAVSLTLCLAFFAVVFMPLMAEAADKPRIAVIEFKNKANYQWWYNRGSAAAQDVFVTELVKSGKFRVIEREQLAALMREKNLSLSGDVSASSAVRAGRLLGVEYLLTGALTEYGKTDTGAHGRSVKGLPGFRGKKSTFVAAINARLIDTETGEIVWADEARGEDAKFKLSIGGFGGGVDNDQRMFDKILKPMIRELTASLKAADI